MKITSGWARGAVLKAPSGQLTRPTGERVRQAIFNRLRPYLDGAAFLDLFAGSGAMGLEALSNGAHTLVAVEKDRSAVAALKANVETIQARAKQDQHPCRIEVRPQDVARVAEFNAGQFGLVWCDPPYDQVLSWLQRLGPKVFLWLADDGLWGIESAAIDGEVLVQDAREFGFGLWHQKRYGDTVVTFFEKIREQSDEQDL